MNKDFKCPDCQGTMEVIRNNRMNGDFELIPICDKCRKAFRGYPEFEFLNKPKDTQ